ncbi:NAD-dependent dehydratase [Polymorphobacter glacialis]|uniref:NAD-dependent dehydratase n=1 Tax=Sandarakinorhabdus glacialis TaxID=1614636 RepID=A0A917E3X8_9SPHN|nr:NAD-dependent epimerase/dehydratase family protein [Polymorphobacter glacialis]GGE01240.1 NAD-dependent dehydratase [Polymorphobacter glacialis]
MTVLLAGATGMVGSRVLARLLAARVSVVPVGRRATGIAGEVVADFAALPELPAAEVAICALGTTIRAAGSEAAFRAVDHDAVLAFARAAKAAGASRFILVSSVGADAGSRVFYSRVKGEVEAALGAMGFARLDIVQPGLILGPRAERRPAEAFFQRLMPVLNPLLVCGLARYGAVSAGDIARAIVKLSVRVVPGRFVHHNRAIRALAA